MDGIRETKNEIRNNVIQILGAIPNQELAEKEFKIEENLFGFANFIEANIALLYINSAGEVQTSSIIKKCLDYNKIVVLPLFEIKTHKMKLLKIDNPDTDLKTGPRNILEPNPDFCKIVPIESLDIAIIPGIAFDEKGGRIGTGEGYYDRLIPKLPITTRKVALAFESQIIHQSPVESHDRNVDIIITDKRTIYKI